MEGPCEAQFAAYDIGGPYIEKCGRPGKLRKKFLMPWGVILCDTCNEAMEAKHRKKEES